MTDLTTLTDEQITVIAAEATGWRVVITETPCWRRERWIDPDGVTRHGPDPLHDLNDAVALAEHVDILWTIGHEVERVEDKGRYSAWAGTQRCEADSPARALTMAVLAAMEKTDE